MILGDRKVAMWALVGSHNYNLNDEKSDRDYKAFVYPSFEDIYHNRKISKAYQGVPNIFEPEYEGPIDYEVHDLRRLPDLLKKVNINFLEVLFSIKDMIHPELSLIFMPFREDYIKLQPARFYMACLGMYYEKMKKVQYVSEANKHLHDQYGYDTKQAMHAIRLLKVIRHYFAENKSFAESILFEGEDRDLLLGIKRGALSLKDFHLLAADEHQRVLLLKAKANSSATIAEMVNGDSFFEPINAADQSLEDHIKHEILSHRAITTLSVL
jgi:predicted nucleotidyltransferase